MKSVWKFFFSNLDTLVAIIISILAAIFGVFGGNQAVILAGIATTLGIIAYGLIRDRSTRENLAKNITSLENLLGEIASGLVKSDNFFVNRTKLPPLPDNLKKAKSTLDIAGTSLLSISVTHQAILRELKESGVKIRLLVSNPDNTSLQEYLAKRYLEAETATVHANQVRASLTSLAPLVSSNRKGGSLQVRITDHVQTFSYIGRDVNTTNGYIQIEFYLNKTGLERDPIFFLEASKDVHWFNEFKKQFEMLWEHAIDVDPRKYS